MKEDNEMEELIKMLEEIKSGIDYAKCENLMDDGIYDSLEIVQLISELEEKYGISIMPEDITPANFNSVNALYDMVKRLKNE